MGILEMDFERILGVTFFISSSHSIMLCTLSTNFVKTLQHLQYVCTYITFSYEESSSQIFKMTIYLKIFGVWYNQENACKRIEEFLNLSQMNK